MDTTKPPTAVSEHLPDRIDSGRQSGASGLPTEARWGSRGSAESSPVTMVEQITGHRDKMTYIFQHEGEVGCIHFDALRGEIYFNGHNAKMMKLTEKHWRILEEFRQKLRHHPKLRSSSYAKALMQLTREQEGP